MRRNLQRDLIIATLGLLAAAGAGATAARADNIVITYSAPGVYAPDFSTNPSTGICAGTSVCDFGVENFSNWTGTPTYTSGFNDAGAGSYNQPSGVSFTGAYAMGAGTTSGAGGQYIAQQQNIYGGVANAPYPELYGPSAPQAPNAGTAAEASYTLNLSSTGVPGINYFGLWISALDQYNDLRIFSGSTLVAEFNSAVLESALGNCSDPLSNAYCGNPTPQFGGGDKSELFAYVNVFDMTGFITSVQFYDAGNSGFESSNHAVAYANPIHAEGTNLPSVPEPMTLALLGTGLAGLAAQRRLARRRA